MPVGLFEEPPVAEVDVPGDVLCPEVAWPVADVLGDVELEFALVAPMPVPIVDGVRPGPDGLMPPVVVIFSPKKPVAGLAWPN